MCFLYQIVNILSEVVCINLFAADIGVGYRCGFIHPGGTYKHIAANVGGSVQKNLQILIEAIQLDQLTFITQKRNDKNLPSVIQNRDSKGPASSGCTSAGVPLLIDPTILRGSSSLRIFPSPCTGLG